MAKLTAKQEMFCKEYLIDLNATQAAIRAGYSEKTAAVTGCENLIKPNIAEHIQTLFDTRAEKVELNSEWVLRNLEKVANRCMQAEPVMVRGENGMEESGEFKFDSSGANKSLELIGKHLKLFTDKVEQDTTFTVIRKRYGEKNGN
jgi:phage terminase small subunit